MLTSRQFINETILLDDIKQKDNLFEYIKEKFEGKCYKQMYINRIIKIIKTDKYLIENNEFDLYYKTNVLFEVEKIELNVSDEIETIITDIHPKLDLISKNEILFIYILNNSKKKYKKGDKVKIKILKTKYVLQSNRIVIISEII